MKVHFIYTKQPTDSWTIYTRERLTDTVDLRDPPYKEYPLQLKYGVFYPYRALFYTYKNFAGYDRNYIDDNTLDVFYNFTLDANTDPVEFGRTFKNDVSNTQNIIVSNFFNFLSTENVPNYTVQTTVEDDNGNITVI
jgi:hypothetical protein